MVGIRPALNNIYVYVRYMQETSKTLNTCKSRNLKDITMSNLQETEISPNVGGMRFLKPFIRVYLDFYLLGLLIDYTRRFLHIEWLRYSPIFCLYINKGVALLINISPLPPGFFATSPRRELKKKGGGFFFGLPKKKGMCPPVVSLNKLFKRNFGLVPSHPIPAEGYPPRLLLIPYPPFSFGGD